MVDFRIQGKRYQKSTRTSDIKEAELILKKIEVEIANGTFGFETLDRKRILLSEFIQKYPTYSKAIKAKNTGARRNEALNMTWDDVDMKNGRITFRQTKSGKNRLVPFNGILTDVFRRMERTGEKPFPFLPDFVTKTFKKVVRESGVKDLSVHSLRHTFASHMVMAGVDIKTVSELLGHSSVRVTETYAHLMPSHLKASVERLRY